MVRGTVAATKSGQPPLSPSPLHLLHDLEKLLVAWLGIRRARPRPLLQIIGDLCDHWQPHLGYGGWHQMSLQISLTFCSVSLPGLINSLWLISSSMDFLMWRYFKWPVRGNDTYCSCNIFAVRFQYHRNGWKEESKIFERYQNKCITEKRRALSAKVDESEDLRYIDHIIVEMLKFGFFLTTSLKILLILASNGTTDHPHKLVGIVSYVFSLSNV